MPTDRARGGGGSPRHTATAFLALMAVAVLVTGCREEEQGRMLNFEEGVYLGPEDQELNEQTLDALRDRHRYQHFGI